jgi:2-oxo-4-hydroxy-4-carboxy--5-ureidoimidazoline (OHCU) decarboxylase
VARTDLFPSVGELNEVSGPAFRDAVAMLFEPAPRFAAWLAAARPFTSDEDLLKAAARIAHRMPDEEKVELINAHPRLGGSDRLSEASRREQGATDRAADADSDPVAAELVALNAAYESKFGFRYLVYVAGRERAALLPEFRASLDRDRSAEMRRALDDTLAIAANRLHFFRNAPGGR